MINLPEGAPFFMDRPPQEPTGFPPSAFYGESWALSISTDLTWTKLKTQGKCLMPKHFYLEAFQYSDDSNCKFSARLFPAPIVHGIS